MAYMLHFSSVLLQPIGTLNTLLNLVLFDLAMIKVNQSLIMFSSNCVRGRLNA